MFDKETYWKRRNNKFHVKNDDGEIVATIEKPLRGQVYSITDTLVSLNTSPNRRARRRRIVNRKFTKAGFENGIRINSKTYNIAKHFEKKLAKNAS